jgi:hypothetical protein
MNATEGRMGIAAYNRGTMKMVRDLDDASRRAEFREMDMLNAMPKAPMAPRPFGPIVFVQGHGGWWAECPVTDYGFWFKELRDAVKAYRVQIIWHDNGTWYSVPDSI